MLKQHIAGQTLLISLKSWRYILSVAALAYLFAGVLLTQNVMLIAASVTFIAGFITLFYCWRLWMDEQFFSLLYQENADVVAFDAAIEALWSKNSKSRSLEQRWLGTGKLIKRAWLFVSLQWCGVLVMLISTLWR